MFCRLRNVTVACPLPPSCSLETSAGERRWRRPGGKRARLGNVLSCYCEILSVLIRNALFSCPLEFLCSCSSYIMSVYVCVCLMKYVQDVFEAELMNHCSIKQILIVFSGNCMHTSLNSTYSKPLVMKDDFVDRGH